MLKAKLKVHQPSVLPAKFLADADERRVQHNVHADSDDGGAEDDDDDFGQGKVRSRLSLACRGRRRCIVGFVLAVLAP